MLIKLAHPKLLLRLSSLASVQLMAKLEKMQIEWVNPDSLVPYAKNAKIHSNEQLDNLAGQIAAFGWDQPIVVDAENVIIKGHARRLAAIRLGLSFVPVVKSTLDEYEAMAARIADNKVAEAPWDPEMLKFDLGTLTRQGIDLRLTALPPLMVNSILNSSPLTHEPGSEEDQSRLDQKKPIECPHCGESFIP